MHGLERNRQRRRLLFVAYIIGWLAVFYSYVLLRIRPELFYQQKPDVFLFDSYFLAGFWDRPGGPVEYASAFLSPLLAYGWLGAGVVTLLTALVCLATRWLIAGVTGTGGRIVFLIPAVLILMMLGQYSHPVKLCVGLFAVLVFANAYVRMGNNHAAVRLAAFAIASALAYYVAAELYVVFALLCGVFELRVKRHRSLGAACVLCAVVVPGAAGAWLFCLGIKDAYQELLIPPARYWLATPSSLPIAMTIRVGLLLFFPVAAIVLARSRHAAASAVANPEAQTRGKFSRLAVQSAVLAVLGVGADLASFDLPTKCLLQMAYSAEHERWTDVLKHARRLPSSDKHVSEVRTVFHVNRALHFSGGLLDRMFSYVQVLNAPTLALRFDKIISMVRMVPLECSDVLFDLGRINESEHMTYEALEVFGERPRTLKRLVHIHVLKGQPEAARRYLALLERSMLHSRWARRMLRQLDADPTLSGVPVIASHRELMLLRDVGGKFDLETMLEQLLERNPHNRMAFEYLMARCLLTRQLDRMVANLHRLDDFDYPHLPLHCEEALVIYLESTGSQEPDLGRRKIRPETRRRYREFMQVLQQFRGNAPAAFVALHRDFGDTYFFCYVFGHNNLQFGQSRPPR